MKKASRLLMTAVIYCAVIIPAGADNIWEQVFFRTKEMKQAGMAGGEAGQYQTSIERSVSNPDIIYSTIDVGYIVKSVNNGKNWIFPKLEGLNCGATLSVAIHPDNPDIIFTFSQRKVEKMSSTEGVYISKDGGGHWENVLDLTAKPDKWTHRRVSAHYHQIEINGKTNTVYFGSGKFGLYISKQGGAKGTWEVKEIFKDKSIRDVRIDPLDSRNMLVSTDEGELLKSKDSGENWEKAGQGLPAVKFLSLVYDPKTAGTVYIAVLKTGLYRSTNAGESFTFVEGTKKENISVFGISPVDHNYMYLMGSEKEQFYSHDGGITWLRSKINSDMTFKGSFWIGDSKGVNPDPRDKNTAITGIGTRFYITNDGGASWEPYNNGYAGWNHVDFPAMPGHVFDSKDPNKQWTFNIDFGMAVTDDNWDTAKYFRGRDTYWRDRTDFGGSFSGGVVLKNGRIIGAGGRYWTNAIYESDNGGVSWKFVDEDGRYPGEYSNGTKGPPWPLPLGYAETIQLHPQDEKIIYCSNYRSDDGGDTWKKMADGSYNILGMFRKNGDIIYGKKGKDKKERQLGTVIYKSTDRGNTWAALPDAGVPVGYRWNSPAEFAVDPVNEDRFYTISGGDGELYHILKYDKNAGWTRLTVKDGREPKGYGIDPVSPNKVYTTLYVSGESFIFKSEDYGNTWTDITKNLPMVGYGVITVSPHDGSLYFNGHIGMWRLKTK